MFPGQPKRWILEFQHSGHKGYLWVWGQPGLNFKFQASHSYRKNWGWGLHTKKKWQNSDYFNKKVLVYSQESSCQCYYLYKPPLEQELSKGLHTSHWHRLTINCTYELPRFILASLSSLSIFHSYYITTYSQSKRLSDMESFSITKNL